MRKQLTILIDCDEVLRNSVGAALKKYNEIKSKKYKFSDVTEWKLDKLFPGLDKEFWVLYGKDCMLNAEPYDDVKNVLKRLMKKHKVIIVSAQYIENEAYTMDWFINNNIPYDDIVFTKDKNSVEGDIIIDDKIGNLKKCISRKICVCRDHKWNKDWKGLRVKNLTEFEQLIKKMEK